MGPEARIQSKVVQYAKKKYEDRIEPRKFQGGRFGSNGWPDYDFLHVGGIFFIEFKAPGEQPTELQQARHKVLRGLGHHVYVVDDVEDGKRVIDREMACGSQRRPTPISARASSL